MTTSEPTEAFVWTWLPGAEQPVVAGRLELADGIVNFNYGQSYLGRADAIPIYLPELPLEAGSIAPLGGLTIPGCIKDGGPDAWGQRVIMQHLLGTAAKDGDPASFGPLTYLLRSGSDRIGALDFQDRADAYVSRDDASAPLESLMEAADLVAHGLPLPPALDIALLHGSSVGGARPKALLKGDGLDLIAKFSSSTDTYPIVKGEFVAMELARRAGLDVAGVELVNVMGRDVLLVQRFDRVLGTKQRRALVSALTILELDEMMARYASYADLAQIVRARFTDATRTLRELFARISFNVLTGNSDDHARNHAAFWDGKWLTLAPAYDVCPQPRSGGETSQAMMIGADGFRMSQLAGCVERASTYMLTESDARALIDRQIDTVEQNWDEVCDLANMTQVDRSFFWGRQFFNAYAFEGYSASRA
ncbi:MAG TPA: HipA domain-containing protein [Solirubrobacteraceae bacterium]|jgi:serine/threonine-protein kinase HipA|nr:HipA domain-containing protein [Solirubrobacteraceae bacterium]